MSTEFASRWLVVIMTVVLSVVTPAIAAGSTISDEDDCTMAPAAAPADLNARCTRD